MKILLLCCTPLALAGAASIARERLVTFLKSMGETADRSYVVIGAHYFGYDRNDPLFRLVKHQAWGGLGLVEASPSISRELKSRVQAKKPMTVDKIIVDEACVAPVAGEKPFFVLNVSEAELVANKLPFWTNQINSLSRAHIEKQLGRLVRGSDWTVYELGLRITQVPVVCRTLQAELDFLQLPPSAIILVDIEGADCALVQASAMHIIRALTATAQRSLFVYEKVHCSASAKALADQALADAAYTYAPSYNVTCRDDVDKESTFCFFDPIAAVGGG